MQSVFINSVIFEDADCQKPKINEFFFFFFPKTKFETIIVELSTKSKVAVLSSSWTPFQSILFQIIV